MKNYSQDVSVYFIASVSSGYPGHKVWNLRKVSWGYVVKKKKKENYSQGRNEAVSKRLM